MFQVYAVTQGESEFLGTFPKLAMAILFAQRANLPAQSYVREGGPKGPDGKRTWTRVWEQGQ